MRARLILAAGITVGLGVALTPAQATPYAGQFRYLDSGTISFKGADGARWLLNIGATQSGTVESRAEQRLYIDLSRCAGSGCTVVGKWARPLTPSEVNISATGLPSFTTPVASQRTTARLSTVLGGLNLGINLADSDQVGGVAFDGLGSSVTPAGIRPAAEQYNYAGGSVKLGRVSCKVAPNAGVIGEVESVDTLGDDARDPRTAPPTSLPTAFTNAKHPASCTR